MADRGHWCDARPAQYLRQRGRLCGDRPGGLQGQNKQADTDSEQRADRGLDQNEAGEVGAGPRQRAKLGGERGIRVPDAATG